MLTIKDLSFRYEPAGRLVLQIEDLRIEAGERVAILGYSGHGKTSLLNVIGALDRSSGSHSGSVAYRDEKGTTHDLLTLLGQDRRRLWAREFGFVFQDPHLMPYLSARDNVASRLIRKGVGVAQARAAGDEALARLGLDAEVVGGPDPTDPGQGSKRSARRPSLRKPRDLSGGQRQRVAVARGLVHSPRLVLADEPTASLDPSTARRTLERVADSLEQTGGTLLMVTHNFEHALEFCDRLILLSDGKVVADLDRSDPSITPGRLTDLLAAPAAVPKPAGSAVVTPSPGPADRAEPPNTSAASRSPLALLGRPANAARNVLRDVFDGRTRGFAWSCFLIAFVNGLALTLLWGLRGGTVEALTAAVKEKPAFRRIEVRPPGVPILSASQVEALGKIKDDKRYRGGIRVEVFQVSQPIVVGASGQLPRLLVLGRDDPLWGEVDPGSSARATERLGVVLSDEQAERFGLIDRPMARGAEPLTWERLGTRRSLPVNCGSAVVHLPVLMVVPRDDLSPRVFQRDGAIGRKTAWLLGNWKPGWEFAVQNPDGTPLARPVPLVTSQELRLTARGETRWADVVESESVVRLTDSSSARGWIPSLRANPTSGPSTSIEIRWSRVTNGGRELDAPRSLADHEAFVNALTEALRAAGVGEIRPGGPVLATAHPEPVVYPPSLEEVVAAQGSVYVDDFWKIPEVLADIRKLEVQAESPVEATVALLQGADSLLRAACWAGLATLALTGVVAIGGGGLALVQQSRGEIGIAMVEGTPGHHVLAHYLGVAALITASGVSSGILIALLAGLLLRARLAAAGRMVGLPLSFRFEPRILAAFLLLSILFATLSVIVPAARVLREYPARLLRSRDR